MPKGRRLASCTASQTASVRRHLLSESRLLLLAIRGSRETCLVRLCFISPSYYESSASPSHVMKRLSRASHTSSSLRLLLLVCLTSPHFLDWAGLALRLTSRVDCACPGHSSSCPFRIENSVPPFLPLLFLSLPYGDCIALHCLAGPLHLQHKNSTRAATEGGLPQFLGTDQPANPS